jgi:hypothetical protein
MSVTTIPLLTDLQGPWRGLQIQFADGSAPVVIDNMYPFSSVLDLKRQLWIQREGDPRWAPERVFLGVPQPDGSLRPLEFHWPESVGITLPDPVPAEARAPFPALFDDAGNRKPIKPTLLTDLVLEAALAVELRSAPRASAVEAPAIPMVVAICMADLAPASSEELTDDLLRGFYQLYFPWTLTAQQVLNAARNTEAIRAEYAATVPYMLDRTGRIEVAQAALERQYGGKSIRMTTMVRMRWTLPPPAEKPESLEETFYQLRATAELPFLRYFPPAGKGTPILKLGVHEDGSLIIDDPKVMTQYLNQPPPVANAGVIVARIPMTAGVSAFTLYMFEDGSTDITLEVPQRGMTYLASVATAAEQMLATIIVGLGFPEGTQPILRDLHATYAWSHPDPARAGPISMSRLKERVAALTPFFNEAPFVPVESRALGTFVWRATSNYESESAQFAYLTQLALNDEEDEDPVTARTRYIQGLAQKFGMSAARAEETLDRWFERRAVAVAPVAGAGAGSLAVAKHSTGVQISVTGAHPEYRIEVQGVDSTMELERVLSVTAVLLGAPASELRIRPPTTAVEAVGVEAALAAAEVKDAVVQVAVEAGGGAAEEGSEGGDEEPDSYLASMWGMMGAAGGEESDSEEASSEEATGAAGPPPPPAAEQLAVAATEAAPAPNLAAAVAEVEEECRGARWTPGEPPLRIAPDYYIAKLKTVDKVLFGYTVPPGAMGSKKSYARSCAVGDGRQPNIMTLSEYARVKRCYEDRVRFVDLPPSKPDDLPVFPGYVPNNKKSFPDEMFTTDPETGRPMWAVLRIANQTNPGQVSYLICAELWCDRDNVPLLPSEYEGTMGRDGKPKPPYTCPFCVGREIADLKAPNPGESVIVRNPKKGAGKVHRYIGIMGPTHPAGHELPCCELTPKAIREYLDQAYKGTLTYAGAASAAATAPQEEGYAEPPPEEELEPGPALGEEASIDYASILGNMRSQYILGSDKSLDAGKIGLLPAYLDQFFGQNGPRSVKKSGILTTFTDDAIVFVRIGVDSRLRQPGLNLFAGLAPLLGFESAEATQRYFLTRPMVRAFESANYGTLLQEFAARATLTDAEVTASLQEFATKYKYTLDASSRPHIIRLYKAWVTFLKYLADQKEPKRLRHIEHLLAQPDVIQGRGLLLVALEQDPATDAIRVICPSFGIPTASYFNDIPVAFIWRDRRLDTWEPIVLYNNTRQAITSFGERGAEMSSLPPPMRASIQRWLAEWRSSSVGCGRPAPPPHVWTPERDTSGLPRLSTLLSRIKGFRPSAIVRDRSNRLAGVLMTGPMVTGTAASMGAGAAPTFFVPCLDDGALAAPIPRVYEASGIPPASLDAYLRYYQEEIGAQYPALKPVKLLARMDQATQVVGFQTAAGVMIPTAPSAVPGGSALPIQQMDQFPWERDTLVLRAPDAPAGVTTAIKESTASVEEQMNEAYQHLRVSVARWLKRDPAARALKEDLNRMLTSQLPLWERRKRLDIRLEPLIGQWIEGERVEESDRRLLPLLRTDCVGLPGEEQCRAAGACRWSGDRCMIHVPYRQEGTNVVRVFTARLSDELLRYSLQRREIYDDSVPIIRTPRGVVRQGDELYIATKPKETASGILERLGFLGQAAMSFPEEMLQFEGLEVATPPTEEDEAGEEEAPAQPTTAAIPEALPPTWITAGFQVPAPAIDLPDAKFLAWASGTGRSLADWTKYIGVRRKGMGLPGDPARPFQWSIQDFYVLAALTSSNILFVRQSAGGRLILDRWIAPPSLKTDKPLFSVLWGPRQLLMTFGAKADYRFEVQRLPADLQELIRTSAPMPEAEARGSVEPADAAENSSSNSGEASPPQPAATQGEGEGGAVPAPRPAPTL